MGASRSSSAAGPGFGEYLSKKEVQDYLRISKGSVEKLMRSGLPFIKLDRRVIFRKQDIDRWLERKVQGNK
jgi:excisionase family DNA binding protein